VVRRVWRILPLQLTNFLDKIKIWDILVVLPENTKRFQSKGS